jgi:hypothetical protein
MQDRVCREKRLINSASSKSCRSTLVAAGFGAYFFLLVISYMLLSNPDIDQVAFMLILLHLFICREVIAHA